MNATHLVRDDYHLILVPKRSLGTGLIEYQVLTWRPQLPSHHASGERLGEGQNDRMNFLTGQC